MFVLIVGGGKVGLNTARQLTQLGHEIVLIEQRRTRYDIIAEFHCRNLLFKIGPDVCRLWYSRLGLHDRRRRTP